MKLIESKIKEKIKKVKTKKGKVVRDGRKENDVEEKENTKTESTATAAAPSVKSISPAIFDYFKSLTSSKESDRLLSGLQLIQHISKAQQDEKRNKELEYTLKRLVRGVGASTTPSRAGFFSTLVGLLKCVSIEVSVTSLLNITKKELQVGGGIVKKEDADAIVGQILVCGAILRSNKLLEASSQDIEEITKTLIGATKHRSYHSAIAYSFITELLKSLSEQQFTASVWPHLEQEIFRPWSKQTLNSVNCIFIAQKRFSSVVSSQYLKSKFSSSQILYPGCYKQILKIFWEPNNPNVILHEAFGNFGLMFANSKHLLKFWTTEVNDHLQTPNKLKEIQTLKIISDIIENVDPNSVNISKLLTDNFIKMMVESIQTIKTRKDETLKAFYDEFFESLNKKFGQIKDEDEKISIIKKLILHPGTLSIEKYTSSRIIHQLMFQLKEEGIKQLFEIYKNIFFNSTPKNPEDKSQEWLNFERKNAGFVLQTLFLNKNVQNAEEWRLEQLKLFMNYGLFHMSEENVITKKENSGKFSEEFGEQMKNMFYSCLQAKQPSLKDEKKLLVALSEELDKSLSSKNVLKKMRGKFEEDTLKVWKKVFKSITTKSKKKCQIQLVFDILLLHMGLQLFRDTEMAGSAIMDLEKCMERTKEKRSVTGEEDEPEWIEVVTDLFLHLLSQNNGSLRHVVCSVFPHLCENLNLTAIHQILAVLDMKNPNPLDDNEMVGDDDDDDEEEDEEENGSNDEEDSDDDEEEEEDDDDDEDVEEEEEEEEESTVTDKLRNALSNALRDTLKPDDDQASIDLDDMTEEEGRKLDEALSAAFVASRKTSASANKKSKSHRIQKTTVMHFRIRVLDLLEIYILNKPKQLVAMEIMLNLFNMIEFCNDQDLKSLQMKVEKLLQKLTSIKHFEKDEEGDINETNICDFIRLIIEKKVLPSIFDFHNKLRTKCCLFLINCSKSIPNQTHQKKLIALFSEFIDDFIISRNPKINIAVLNEIFKLKWDGVDPLIRRLVENGLLLSVRTFRRIQVLEILTVFLKNFDKKDDNTLKSLSKQIEIHVHQMSELQPNKISNKEFSTVLDVIFIAHRKFKLLGNIIDEVQKIRKNIKLDSFTNYKRICDLYKVPATKNSEVLENATVEINGSVDEEETSEKPKENGKGVKRKNKNKDLQKEKKIKKEARMQVSSKGLNEEFEFTNNQDSVDVDMSDGSAIEESDDE